MMLQFHHCTWPENIPTALSSITWLLDFDGKRKREKLKLLSCFQFSFDLDFVRILGANIQSTIVLVKETLISFLLCVIGTKNN